MPTRRVRSERVCPRCVLTLAYCLVLVGCGGYVQGIVDFQQGWRQAEVIEIGAAAELTHRGVTDCRDKVSSADIGRMRFAVLDYRLQARRHRHIVVFDSASGATVGDKVYTNVAGCGAPFKVLERARP